MSRIIFLDEITDSDLRRALVVYLIGLWIYLLSLHLWIGNFVAGFAADPTTADPEFTPQWIMVGLLVASGSVVVISQLWYLRTQHVRSKGRSTKGFLKEYIIELLVIFWVLALWAVFGLIYTDFSDILGFRTIGFFVGSFISFSAWVLVAGIPVYSLVILYWIIKRYVGRKYPDMSRHARIAVSSALGLVLAAVIVLLQSFAALALLNSVAWR